MSDEGEPFLRGTLRKHERGWIVQCQLCGKRTKKMYVTEHLNPGDALMAAEHYWTEHQLSEAHRAAVAAYNAAPEETRRQAARDAAREHL